MALTQAQITQYYATEGKKANPLSPTAWLAQQTAPSSTQSPVNAPQSTITPKTTSNLSQSQLDAIEAQISGIRNQTQAIATQIPAATLKTPASVSLPKEQPSTTSYSGITAGATSSIDSYIKNMNDLMASYIANAPKPTDMSAIYDQLESELGIDSKQKVVNQKQSAVNTATAELNNIQAQIQAINDEEKAAQLQLEKNAATGADITSAFLGRQQTEISRNAAIKALPLQSQALVAQAKVAQAQGDQQLAQDMLEQAEKKLNTVFQIKSDYETQKYQYSQNLINKMFEFASDIQKTLLTARQQEEAQAYQQYQDTLALQQEYTQMAIKNGQGYLASSIASLDAKSPDFQTKLATLVRQIEAPASDIKTSIANVGGHSVLINTQTGETIKDLGVANSEISSGGGVSDKLLSPTEAAALGVAYGTTESQAAAMKIIPQGKTSQAQQTVAGYAARIEQSEPILTSLQNSINKMNILIFEAQLKLPAAMQSGDIQQYMQASRNFINSVLRRESGAVISPSEFSEARKQYLPQPGDTAGTLKQKAINRQIVLENYKNAAGNAYESVDSLLGTQSSGTSFQSSSGKTYNLPN